MAGAQAGACPFSSQVSQNPRSPQTLLVSSLSPIQAPSRQSLEGGQRLREVAVRKASSFTTLSIC